MKKHIWMILILILVIPFAVGFADETRYINVFNYIFGSGFIIDGHNVDLNYSNIQNNINVSNGTIINNVTIENNFTVYVNQTINITNENNFSIINNFTSNIAGDQFYLTNDSNTMYWNETLANESFYHRNPRANISYNDGFSCYDPNCALNFNFPDSTFPAFIYMALDPNNGNTPAVTYSGYSDAGNNNAFIDMYTLSTTNRISQFIIQSSDPDQTSYFLLSSTDKGVLGGSGQIDIGSPTRYFQNLFLNGSICYMQDSENYSCYYIPDLNLSGSMNVSINLSAYNTTQELFAIFYNLSNPNNFINFSNLTAYNTTLELQNIFYLITNPRGFINDSYGNLTYYLKSNPSNFINMSNLSGYNTTSQLSTLFYSINNPSGYWNFSNISGYGLRNESFNNATYLSDVYSTNNYIGVGGSKNKSLSFNESVLNSTINQSITNALATTTYYPNVTFTTGGTNTTGNISLMWFYDGNSYNVTEGAGANPLDVYINFTNVTGLNQIVTREFYSGSASHHIQIQLWDYKTGQFQTYYEFVGQGGFNIITIPIYDASDHINNSIVQFRFHHIENGLPTHSLMIDFVWLLQGVSIGATPDLTGYARYNFGSNNFNGQGNFNTSGNMSINNLNVSGVVTVQNFTVLDTLTTTRIFSNGNNFTFDLGSGTIDKYIKFQDGGSGNMHLIFLGAGINDFTIDYIYGLSAVSSPIFQNTGDISITPYSAVTDTHALIKNTNPSFVSDLWLENNICNEDGSLCYSLSSLNATTPLFNYSQYFNQFLNSSSSVTFFNETINGRLKVNVSICTLTNTCFNVPNQNLSTTNSPTFNALTVNNGIDVPAYVDFADTGTVAFNKGKTASCAGQTALIGGRIQVNTSCWTTGDIVLLTRQNSTGSTNEVFVNGTMNKNHFNISSTSTTDTGSIGWMIVHLY